MSYSNFEVVKLVHIESFITREKAILFQRGDKHKDDDMNSVEQLLSQAEIYSLCHLDIKPQIDI